MSNAIDITPLKEKIHELNQQAWEVRVNDLPKSFELSQESVKLARDINYPKGLAEALRSLGFCYIRLFKNDEADPLLKESLSLFESLNDLKGQAIVYEYLGIIQRNWGNLSASLELLLKSHALILQSGDPEIEMTTCYQIGVTYKHLGNHENALDYLYRSLSIAKEIDFKLMEAYSTNIIGSIYFDNGDYKKALDCYQQGLTIRQQSHDKWGEAGSLDNIGFTYLKLKETEKAIDYCKQSLDISQSTGDKKGEANALLHLAEIYEQANDIKQASKLSNESLEIRKVSGDRRGEVEVFLFLANLHRPRKDVEDHQIHEWLFGALNIADEIKAKDLLSKTHYYLHEYYMQKENFKESVIQLEAHLQIEKELHKNAINQKVQSLEISRKAEAISQHNKELTELNERIERANAELKIEASLERVRTVAMSMMKPDDLISICQIQFKELLHLGFTTLRNVIIDIFNDDKGYFIDYDYSDETGGSAAKVRYGMNPVVDNFLRQIKTRNDAFSEIIIDRSQLKDWKKFRKETGQIDDPRLENAEVLYYYFYSIGLGDIGISTFNPIAAEQLSILKRFRNVFDLAYRRYTDITNAEAQAREAQIEAALEKVRSRTMAMQKSNELPETALLLFQQFRSLGETAEQISIGIFNEEKGIVELSATVQGSTVQKTFLVDIDEPLAMNKHYLAWKEQKKSMVLDLAGEDLKAYNAYRSSLSEIKFKTPDEGHWVMHTAFFSKGMIVFSDHKMHSHETLQLLERFAGVFDGTYTRFLDLQKAEAQTREALIEGALERVRARALAMQEPEELKDVAQVLRNEMGALGIEELETSSIYIHGHSSENVECWYALQDPKQTEKKMVSDYFVLNLDDTWVGREMKKFYRSDEKQTSLVMSGANRKEWIQYCYEHSPVFSGFYGETIPDRTYHLYKFSHGYIGAAAPGDISAESWRLLSRAASVFSLAYSRFKDLTQARNDLVKLKEEKKRAEDALSELQATQKQLIQSEKMASLGELTAGIAHEIQNPLNFVNNFSDVSNELLEEMKEELATGNTQSAMDIAKDVKDNLEKILHHGKRADAIVKGMLQHSRSSSGQKEFTDINVLAEEYLRLAYHGLRAKDKSFNANFKTEFDPTVGKINIIPQDIGRVILNLINNAFYAVNEKRQMNIEGYEPTVTVSTKKIANKSEIRVSDNGNGIPQKILDKIFQPFFTTKPTGQGTGLGLSLAYDIVTKGHGGELKVETKEGEGSEFLIQLTDNATD